jgi:hypothetical protein
MLSSAPTRDPPKGDEPMLKKLLAAVALALTLTGASHLPEVGDLRDQFPAALRWTPSN